METLRLDETNLKLIENPLKLDVNLIKKIMKVRHCIWEWVGSCNTKAVDCVIKTK